MKYVWTFLLGFAVVWAVGSCQKDKPQPKVERPAAFMTSTRIVKIVVTDSMRQRVSTARVKCEQTKDETDCERYAESIIDTLGGPLNPNPGWDDTNWYGERYYSQTFAAIYEPEVFAGDSIRQIVTWTHPNDGGGNEDSTKFRIKASRNFVFMRGPYTAPNYLRRKFGPTVTADTIKYVKPNPGDSIIFQVDSFQLFRKGQPSLPGSAGWKYVRTLGPPPLQVPKILTDSF